MIWIKLIPITSVHISNNLLGNAPETDPGNKQRGTQQIINIINTHIYIDSYKEHSKNIERHKNRIYWEEIFLPSMKTECNKDFISSTIKYKYKWKEIAINFS